MKQIQNLWPRETKTIMGNSKQLMAVTKLSRRGSRLCGCAASAWVRTARMLTRWSSATLAASWSTKAAMASPRAAASPALPLPVPLSLGSASPARPTCPIHLVSSVLTWVPFSLVCIQIAIELIVYDGSINVTTGNRAYLKNVFTTFCCSDQFDPVS